MFVSKPKVTEVPTAITLQGMQRKLRGTSFSSGDGIYRDDNNAITKSVKMNHLISSILSVNEKYLKSIQSSINQMAIALPKIIVFSQFGSFLDRLTIEFREREIDFSDISYGNDAHKARGLQRFQYVDSCCVLLISTDGARGLDLSFGTHIYLLDSLIDVSLEQQIIGRAYRMGTKHSVVVEFIYCGKTIDELIYLENLATRAGNNFDSAPLDSMPKDTEYNVGKKRGRPFSSCSCACTSSSTSSSCYNSNCISAHSQDIYDDELGFKGRERERERDPLIDRQEPQNIRLLTAVTAIQDED